MERVRLYPTARQVARLTKMLDVTRQLYNAALEERIEAYRRRGVSETASMQYRELSELRAEDARVASVYRECSDAALPGSILRCGIFSAASTWREAGVSAVSFREPLGDGRIFARLARIALRRASIEGNRPRSWPYSLRKGGPVPAFGRAMISRRGGRWYGIFECERAVASLPKTGRVVGLDRGVVAVVATSDGELFTLPASVERHRARVRGAQKRVSRRRRGGGRRASARMILARAHERLASARRDFLHKLSRALVDRYDVIALEKLKYEQ